MDSDMWISRLAAAKRHYALRYQQSSSSSDRSGFDEFEMEEEVVRPEFPCPYCYEDHDIASLCSHLEEEHLFESKVAVCPICSVKITKDMLNHITVQHGYLFKMQRRRRLQRYVIPSGQTLSLLGKDLREAHLQVLLGNGGHRSSNHNASNISTDPFLSSLVLNFPTYEADETAKPSISATEDTITTTKPYPTRWGRPTEDTCNEKEKSLPSWKSSFESSLTYEERERRRKQATGRATFVQDLLLSTLLGD